MSGPAARGGADRPLGPEDARRLEQCVRRGGVAVFPADTVYGLCCDPEDPAAVERIYELKGRPPQRPSAIMFFSLTLALESLTELRPRERAALSALLPGPVTLLLANPRRRYGPACGPDPDTLGLRVPLLAGGLAALGAVAVPVMQSSANISGEADARRLQDVPERLRRGVDLLLDGGDLPGLPSTVVDLRDYAEEGTWKVLRDGALSAGELSQLLARAGGT